MKALAEQKTQIETMQQQAVNRWEYLRQITDETDQLKRELDIQVIIQTSEGATIGGSQPRLVNQVIASNGQLILAHVHKLSKGPE